MSNGQCRHCGEAITLCIQGCWAKGWTHVTNRVPPRPLAAHYCNGKTANPVAEPVRDWELDWWPNR